VETVTFYSYKGGSGRSLLLANAAQFLALAGKRVVALDLDLEAPGLHYKLRTGEPAQRSLNFIPDRGVVDYLLRSVGTAPPESVADYVLSVAMPPGSAALWLMPAGAAPSGTYWKGLTALAHHGLLGDTDSDAIATFLELQALLAEELKADFLLIDARTGITELGGIATTLLADKVVSLLLDNPESLAGTRAVLRSIAQAVRLDDQAPVEVVPVLSRVREANETAERRVISFLNEPGASPAETLSLHRLFVLEDDPYLARSEHVLLDGSLDAVTSALGMGYLGVMRHLFPSVTGSRANVFRRQEAVRQVQQWLSWRFAWGAPVSSGAFEHGLRVPISSDDAYSPVRYVDLALFLDPSRSIPFVVAEYIDDPDDLADSDAWTWWQRNVQLNQVVLFARDVDGRLMTRRFVRAADGSLNEKGAESG
jgi:CobQ/CobB/MinD/ParA nucleotide binding domain